MIIKRSTINARDNKLTLAKWRKSSVESEQARVRFAAILNRFVRESRSICQQLVA